MDIKTIGQIVGMFAAVILISSFQFKKNKYFYLFQLSGNVGFVLHYLMLGAYTGMLLNFLGIIRAVVMILRGRGAQWTKSRWTTGTLLALCLLCGVLGWQSSGWLTVLPCAGMIAGTVAMVIGDGKSIRLWQLYAVSPLWLIYNIAVFSVSGIITEAFNIVSTALSIARFGLKALASEK